MDVLSYCSMNLPNQMKTNLKKELFDQGLVHLSKVATNQPASFLIEEPSATADFQCMHSFMLRKLLFEYDKYFRIVDEKRCCICHHHSGT